MDDFSKALKNAVGNVAIATKEALAMHLWPRLDEISLYLLQILGDGVRGTDAVELLWYTDHAISLPVHWTS